MKNIYTYVSIFLFALFLFPQHTHAQNGIIGNGWAGMDFVTIVGMSAGTGTSQIITRTPAGTGNQFFRMANGSNQQSPSATCTNGQDTQVTDVTGATEYTASNNNCTNGAWFINMPNTLDAYVIKSPNSSNNKFRVFRVQGGIVRTIASVTQSPLSNAVKGGDVVTVTANLSGAFGAGGQASWLRYTTDNFATSTVVKMSMVTATSYTATIPSATNAVNANVIYYVFTSGDLASIAPTDADYFTFNLNNNGGSNYSYIPQPGTIGDGNWSNTAIWANGVIPVAGEIANIEHNVNVDVNVTRSAQTIIATNKTFTINSGFTFNTGASLNGAAAGALLQVNGTFELSTGGFTTFPATRITYATNSTLKYSTGGTYNRSTEWNTPHNVLVTNSTNLTLGNKIAGADLTVNGNLQIDLASSVNLSGTANIILKGNVTNNGIFTPNQKKVTFDGTTQSISGTGVTNFYDLDINASANITTNKTLSLVDFGGNNGTININGTLDMTTQQILSNSVGTKTINILGTFKTANTNGFTGSATTAIENDNVTVNMGLGCTVEYNGANQNVSERVDYENIIFSGTGTKTCQGTNPVIQKNLTIQNGTTLNIGTTNITLRGNWTNNGAFTPLAKKVSMDGNNINQTIGGTSVTTFYQLTINKNNTVPNKWVTLNQNINITGTSLFLGANSAILSIKGSSANLGGKLNLNGFDINFGDFGFLEEDYTSNPQEDDLVTDLTATTEANKGGKLVFNNRLVQTNTTFAATVYNAGYMSIYRTTGANYTVNVIRRHYSAGFGQGIKRIYDVTVASGTAAGSNSVLAFGYKRSELNGLADNANNDLLMSKWEAGTGWVNSVATTHNTSNVAEFFGQINLAGVNSFSAWTASSATNPLPITLVYFDAQYLKEKTTLIAWKTLSQVDNAYFEVEKSINGNEFVKIQTIDGAGTTNQIREYRMLDEDFTQSAYYRLRQVDINGKFTYSQVEYVKYDGNLVLEIYPNPTTDRINIKLNENSEQNELQITDLQGKFILQAQGNITTLEQNINQQLPNWARGIYFVKIRTKTKTYLQKLRKD